MKNKNLLTTVLLIIFFSLVSFLAGQKSSAQKLPQNFERRQSGDRNQAGGGNMQSPTNQMRGGQILGEITSVDADKLTIMQLDGSSKVILFGADTNIVKSSPAITSDLKIGTKISVFGRSSTDALINAQSIQIDPQIRIFATPSATQKK